MQQKSKKTNGIYSNILTYMVISLTVDKQENADQWNLITT